MSTTYYICRKHEYERSEAIISYTERIHRTLFSYLDAALPPELKDDVQLTDDLEEAISPMCRELNHQIGYDQRCDFAPSPATRSSGTEKKLRRLASKKRMNWLSSMSMAKPSR